MAKSKGDNDKPRSRYHALLVTLIKRLLRENPLLTRGQLGDALKTARAQSGGYARAEQAKSATLAADPDPDSFEELIAKVQTALQATFGADAWSVATYPAFVVYYHGAPTMPDADDDPTDAIDPFDNAWEEATEGAPDGDNDADDQSVFWKVEYSRDAADTITFGARTQVEKDVAWVGDGEGDDGPDSYEEEIDELEDALGAMYGNRVRIVASYPDRVIYCLCDASGNEAYYEQQYTEDEETEQLTFGDKKEVSMSVSWSPVAAEAGTAPVSLAAKFTDKPWNGAASKYKSTAEYCDASLVNGNTGPREQWTQEQCKLPVKEPDGTINRNALRNAAARIDQVKGVSPAAKSAAKKKLSTLKKQAGIGDVAAEALDYNNLSFAPVALRLADNDAPLPVWQQLHRIGKWVVPHASGQKIVMTREIGNTIIDNFRRGVVRRGVPLDERHLTDGGGHALGWLEEIRWGSEGQGLPGQAEPDGSGSILYGRFRYNDLGQAKLKNEHYKYISPQYWLDYPDAESGHKYGPAIVAVGATNNPYLRIRSIQGEPAPEPVAVLEDGLIGYLISSPESDAMDQIKLEEMQARLEATEKQLMLEQRRRWVSEVDAYLNTQVREGLSPAIANRARPILLSAAPEADAVITLAADAAAVGPTHGAMSTTHTHEHSDQTGGLHTHKHTHDGNGDHGHAHDGVKMLSDEPPTHNLHNAIKALLAEIPKKPLGVALTHQDDSRPHEPTDPGAPTLLDDQINQYVKGLRELARLDGANIDGVLASTAKSDGDL